MDTPLALRLTPGALATAVDDDPLRAIFARLAGGEAAALGPLYDSCGAELYGLALWLTGRAEDAADAVHDALVKVAGRGAALSGVRSPRGYLLQTVRRVAIDTHRRRRPVQPVDDLLLEAPCEDPVLAADARRASALVKQLPVAQREAIYLHCHAGLSFAEIGRVTGVPTFTAASRYRLGIARLRGWLGVAP